MEEEPTAAPTGLPGKGFDIYTGDTIGQLPLAKIKSHAETILPPEKANKRLFGRSKEKPQPRKSVISEVG